MPGIHTFFSSLSVVSHELLRDEAANSFALWGSCSRTSECCSINWHFSLKYVFVLMGNHRHVGHWWWDVPVVLDHVLKWKSHWSKYFESAWTGFDMFSCFLVYTSGAKLRKKWILQRWRRGPNSQKLRELKLWQIRSIQSVGLVNILEWLC